MIKFWLSRAPGKGVCGGAKILGSALLQPARSVCVSLSAFSLRLTYPTKSKNRLLCTLVTITLKVADTFHQIWHIAVAMNAYQCGLQLSTSRAVCMDATLLTITLNTLLCNNRNI